MPKTCNFLCIVHVIDPLALYTVRKVLFPKDIFSHPSLFPVPTLIHEAESLSPSRTTASSSSSDNTSSKTHSNASFLYPQQSIYVIVPITVGALILLARVWHHMKFRWDVNKNGTNLPNSRLNDLKAFPIVYIVYKKRYALRRFENLCFLLPFSATNNLELSMQIDYFFNIS